MALNEAGLLFIDTLVCCTLNEAPPPPLPQHGHCSPSCGSLNEQTVTKRKADTKRKKKRQNIAPLIELLNWSIQLTMVHWSQNHSLHEQYLILRHRSRVVGLVVLCGASLYCWIIRGRIVCLGRLSDDGGSHGEDKNRPSQCLLLTLSAAFTL